MKFNSKLLKKLTETYSPSGNENKISELIEKEISPYVDNITRDNMGNLICRKKGKGKKIMVAMHMDQIGIIATKTENNGYIRFANIGGISPHISLNQKVIFENGIVGVIDREGKTDIGKLKLDDLFIDIGCSNKEEVEKSIRVGDMAVYKTDYFEDDKRVVSGALDNRVGCLVGIEAAKRIEKENVESDIYFTFTVQEEVGLRGAKTAAYSIDPELAIAVDITGSGDTPEDNRLAIELGKGTAIKVKDNGIIVNPKIKENMENMAKLNNIPYQLEVLEFGSTDSGSIHLTKEGILTGVISIPTRYIHSPVETIYKSDVENSIVLLQKILENK